MLHSFRRDKLRLDIHRYVLQPVEHFLHFEPHDDRDGLVARAVEAVESLDAAGLEATQRQFN